MMLSDKKVKINLIRKLSPKNQCKITIQLIKRLFNRTIRNIISQLSNKETKLKNTI